MEEIKMKRIISIVFATMLAGLAISCQKEASLSGNTVASVKYTFNISVNEQFGFDSDASTKGGPQKTYKTAWASGDRIFLFFKPTDGSLLDDSYATLTYNGSSWDGAVTEGQSSLGEGGTLSAIYVYNLGSSVMPVFSDGKWTIASGNVFYNCQTGVSYAVSDSEISASLNLAAPTDFVQFYVYGTSDEPLTCDKVKGWKDVAIGSDMAFSNATCTGYMDGFANSGNSYYKEFYGRIDNGGISLKGVTCNFSMAVNGKVYEHTAAPSTDARSFTMSADTWTEAPGQLPGLFSIASGKLIRFSQGNLLYDVNATTNKWKFYENQYDCASSYEPNIISLFTWGYNATKSIVPDGNESDNVSITSGNLSQEQDWGSQIGDGNTWRTLTKAEWQYLFNMNNTYGEDNRSGKYKYGVTVCGKANCVVLLPDNWQWDASIVGADWQTDYPITSTQTSPVTWQTMEEAGAVCLPAAGIRDGSDVSNVLDGGIYWSSTADDESSSYLVYFHSRAVSPDESGLRFRGCSVRLITESE